MYGKPTTPQVSSKLNHPTPHLQEQELLWLHSWLDWYLAEKQAAERLSHRLLLQDPATVVPRLQMVAKLKATQSQGKSRRESAFVRENGEERAHFSGLFEGKALFLDLAQKMPSDMA